MSIKCWHSSLHGMCSFVAEILRNWVVLVMLIKVKRLSFSDSFHLWKLFLLSKLKIAWTYWSNTCNKAYLLEVVFWQSYSYVVCLVVFIQKYMLSLAKQRRVTPNMFFRVMRTDFPQIPCRTKCKVFNFAESFN